MCWQSFAKCRCGHTKLLERLCDHARELDLPLWIKTHCPNYRITHKEPGCECGEGRYYCAETHDGQYLDWIHHEKSAAERRVIEINTLATQQLVPARNQLAQDIKKQCSDVQDAKRAFNRHPRQIEILHHLLEAEAEKTQLTDKIKSLASVIMYSGQYYLMNAVGPGKRKPPLPDSLYKFEYAGSNQDHDAPMPSRMPSVQRPMLSTPYAPTVHHVQPTRPVRAVEALQDQQIAISSTDSSTSIASLKLKGSGKAHGRPRKPVEPVSAPVRRSARAKKKVDYAEDEVSETSSPGKSPSPWASPVKAQSLKQIILEQKMRDQALRDMKQSNSPIDRGQGSATPDTIIMARTPNSRRDSHDYKSPDTQIASASYYSRQGTLDAESQSAQAQAPSGAAEDVHTYATMRQSLNAPPRLAQSNAWSPQVSTGSPQKRNKAGSLPSAKRVRLSLPGDMAPTSTASSPTPPSRRHSIRLPTTASDPVHMTAPAANMTLPPSESSGLVDYDAPSQGDEDDLDGIDWDFFDKSA